MVTGKRLLILSEAGEGIGFGHYSRCVAIQQYFQGQSVGADIILHVKGEQESLFKNVTLLNWTENYMELNRDNRYSHLLVDSYLVSLSILSSFQGKFEKVVALDDYHRLDNEVDLIINPNIYGGRIKYSGHAVGGSEFIILRESFRKELRKIEIKDTIHDVLITLGGSDFRKILPALMELVSKYCPELSLYVVAASNSYAEELSLLNYSNKHLIFPFVNEIEMKDLMLSCDMAISACGQTLHELAWLGVPTIGICVSEDQVMNMKEYVSNGFLQAELHWNDANLEKKITGLFNQMKGIEERKRTHAIAADVSYNCGLTNIFHEILR